MLRTCPIQPSKLLILSPTLLTKESSPVGLAMATWSARAGLPAGKPSGLGGTGLPLGRRDCVLILGANWKRGGTVNGTQCRFT